jgi:hypothetical protein
VVTSARGSATWKGSNSELSGEYSVTFTGLGGHGLLTNKAGSIGVVHGRATYTDQATYPDGSTCGPYTDTEDLPYAGLSLIVRHRRKKAAFVEATWNFPFPHASYCGGGDFGDIATPLEKEGLLSEKVPLAHFARHTVVLKLSGHPKVTGSTDAGPFTGTFTFNVTMTFDRI